MKAVTLVLLSKLCFIQSIIRIVERMKIVTITKYHDFRKTITVCTCTTMRCISSNPRFTGLSCPVQGYKTCWNIKVTVVVCESFQLQMGFAFPFLCANDYCSCLLNIRARIFYSLVRRRYIRKVSVQLVPTYFSRDCSTDSISCSERKKPDEKKIKTRQQIKKGISKRCCRRQSTWLVIAPLSHRYRSAFAPLPLRFLTAQNCSLDRKS